MPRIRAVPAMLLMAMLLLVPQLPASAHAAVVSTYPSNGSTVPEVPSAVIVTLSDDLESLGSGAEVTGPAGSIPTTVSVLGHDLIIPLPDTAPAGAYQVDWRVTSADGHPVSGTLSFTAENAGGVGPGVTQTEGAADPDPTSTGPTATAPTQPAPSRASATGAGTTTAARPSGTTTGSPTRSSNTVTAATPSDSPSTLTSTGVPADGSRDFTWLVAAGVLTAAAGMVGVMYYRRRRSDRG